MHRNNLFSSNESKSLFLNDQEKRALNYIETTLSSENTTQIDKIIEITSKCSPITLEKYCNMSSSLRNFCSSNEKFQISIANRLGESGYINIEINSMDGKENLKLFDLFVASGYFHAYYNLPDIRKSQEARSNCIQALNRACEIGLYYALMARCDTNVTKLLSSVISPDKKEETFQSLLADVNRLSNLYWGIGYIQAFWILLEVADNFYKAGEDLKRVTTIREESMVKALCASLLEDNKHSQEIIKITTDGKDYFTSAKEKNIHIENWEDAKIKIRSWAGSQATYERLLNAAKNEINSKSDKIEAKPS